MPSNPIERGTVVGSLMQILSHDANGRRGYVTLLVKDGELNDWETGLRTSFERMSFFSYDTPRFRWKTGDQVLIAMSTVPSKIIHLNDKPRTVYADDWPDSRLSLFDLIARWLS